MAITSSLTCSPNPDDGIGQFFGPGHVDSMIRQAIQFCWMALPNDKRNVDEVERQMRRLVERALRDAREDSASFRPTEENP